MTRRSNSASSRSIRTLAVFALGMALAATGLRAQEVRQKDLPDGPAPVVDATEEAMPASPVFAPSADAPAAAPNHPPMDLIPPMPMPTPPPPGQAASTSSGPGSGVMYDPRTRTTREWPVPITAALGDQAVMGGGYDGADGGSQEDETLQPATMGGAMSLLSAASRAAFPWRMNVKLVLRFGASYFVCSGTMRDMRTVLTAGHCVHQGGPSGNWADEIWVYPGWDGAGSIIPPSSIINPYGWAHSTLLGSWTGWTVNGDITYDVGIVALDRAVGALTGWFGWSYGGTCPGFWTTTTINNASYPAEGCGQPGLHNGRDMYYWFGTFDSCPSTRRLGLTTTGGCFNAIWGGMSGSGVYYIDSGTGNRYVHGITSTSNRTTYAEYQRQFQEWVDYDENTFIPMYGRGSTFDLQPLDMNEGPTVVPAGSSTTLLNHLAANATNGTANGTWTYRVYLSTNDDISTADTLLSVQNYSWNFAALGTVRVNMVQVTIPSSTPPGNYYLGVIYDNATDGNTANNDTDGWDAVAITVTKPDLDITALSGPTAALPGSSITVANTVQNVGNATAGGFRVGLYLSADTACTTGDTFLGSRSLTGLGAGASSAANTLVTIPASTPLGTRYVCAIADDLGQVAETSEGNNTAFTAISIVQPDLLVPSVSAPSKASPGSAFNVSNMVRNGGTAAAGAFRVGLYLSADAACTTADTFLASRSLAGLAAGASSSASTPVTIPAGIPLGAYRLCVIADDLSQVTESNEANNTNAAGLSVVSATPTITLKVNGTHPTPPFVHTPGPYKLTLDVSDSTYTASVDWYWALVVNGTLYWVTSSGVSTVAAPLLSSPPVPLSTTLIDTTLPTGTTLTSYFFMLNGSTVVAIDAIQAAVP